MIKRIRSDQLQPGMFIHDLNCGWMDHPFVFNSFKVDDEKTIERVIASGIRELYIDSGRGLDVTNAQTHDEFHAELHDQITALACGYVVKEPPPVPIHEESVQVKAVFHEAHRVVNHLMSDVRLGKQIRVEKMTPVVSHITDSIFRNKDAFISLSRIKKKDEYTFQHSVSVCALMVAFCREMEYERELVMEAGLGGLLHDAGKMKIPDYILNKPGHLDESEFEIMKSHASLGLEMLKQTPDMPETVLLIAGQHHERYDGTGYPDKLRVDAISQFGQMAAIVDVYDALTSDRIYHKGLEPTAALKKLFEWSRFHFNPVLVQRFIRLLGIYPVGSLVRLESGVLGVVVKSGSENLLRPTVRIVYSTKHGHFVAPYDLDLSVLSNDSILQHESPRKWKIDPYSYLQR